MRIRATDPKGAHTGHQELILGSARPRLQGGRDGDGNLIPFYVGIGGGKVQVRWNLAMLQRKHRLDHPGNARGGLQMGQITLDGTDQQRRCTRCTKDGTQRPNFNRITQGGAGAVRFDIGHIVGGDMGIGQGLAQQFFLGAFVRHR